MLLGEITCFPTVNFTMVHGKDMNPDPLTKCLDKIVWRIMWSRVQLSGLGLGRACDLHGLCPACRPQGIPGSSGLESAL